MIPIPLNHIQKCKNVLSWIQLKKSILLLPQVQNMVLAMNDEGE